MREYVTLISPILRIPPTVLLCFCLGSSEKVSRNALSSLLLILKDIYLLRKTKWKENSSETSHNGLLLKNQFILNQGKAQLTTNQVLIYSKLNRFVYKSNLTLTDFKN